MSFIQKYLTSTSERSIPKLDIEQENILHKLVQKTNTIEEHFKSKDISISIKDTFDTIPVIDKLSVFIAENFKNCYSFLKYLRGIIRNKNFKVEYNLNFLADIDLNKLLEFALKLSQYGIIADFYHNKFTNIFYGNVSSAPRVINFLNGFYLEIYAKQIVENVLSEYSARLNLEYELMHNVVINRSGVLNELDLVFRLGDKIFWSEIKSGKFSDFDHYRQIGLTLGLNPDRHILLAAEKNNDDTDAISWFYQFYVANIENFEIKLKNMLNKLLEEKC